MQIQFDRHQQYQLDAVSAVVDLFDGQPLTQTQLDLGVGNQLALDEETMLDNVRRVQQRNGLPSAAPLDGMNFSVEMETGTGKTYVYLRTIYELNARYGLAKFIILVPGVAIREGVIKNLQITADHFRSLYANRPCDYQVYDSRRVAGVRQFAGSHHLQILVINIDALNKKANNIIHKENDRLAGHRPVDLIQAVRPIVVLDEPQNMETEPARAAIASLNPLCTLRYSATHRHPYNLLYRLDPVRAYEMQLVKRIEVDSVRADSDFNQPFIGVSSIEAARSGIRARLAIDVNGENGPVRKTVSVSRGGEDLYEKSNRHESYRGYVVDQIDAGSGSIAFSNGVSLNVGQTQGERADDLMRVQVYETVREHLEKERRCHTLLPVGRRLKVLSLFLIDRVANYATADGRIRRWFVAAYTELARDPRYQPLGLPLVAQVHKGYFAEFRGKPRDTSGKTAADDDAYELIMRDKEKLLSPDEPVRFIFSHSALREGWDNPNVFQICTLNETKSQMKKRQEIGRGLRLPVDETGRRVLDPQINRLTVVANESYAEFARALQSEMAAECGVRLPARMLENKREQRTVRLKPGWCLNPDFGALWERIKHHTRYSLCFSTADLVGRAATAVRDMPALQPPRIRAEKAAIQVGNAGVFHTTLAVRDSAVSAGSLPVPDLLGYLQRETELTRSTLAEILAESGRLADVAKNPQQFLDQALKAIRLTLEELVPDGIVYERITGQEYDMRRLAETSVTGSSSHMLDVNKTIYDAIVFDSEGEAELVRELEACTGIKFFLKLPSWFKVETPFGAYQPGWAVVRQADEPRYLVRATPPGAGSGALRTGALRPGEWARIRCARAHFAALGVGFEHPAGA